MSWPATMSATWPCGHERTEANTQSIGVAGLRCRTCRRRINRESRRRCSAVETESVTHGL